jgi:gliding motility-associated-like protein
LLGDDQDLCITDRVTGVSYDPTGETRDPNDVLIYRLLDDQDSVLAESYGPDFFFNSNTMNIGETYYIRAYLGSQIAGQFDFDDRCLDSIGDIAVTWHGFPTPIVAPDFDTITCTRTSVDIDASSSIGNDLTYEWSTGDTDPIITVTTPGDYSVTVTDELGGCTADTTITIYRSADIPDIQIAQPDILTCDVLEVDIDASQSTDGPTIEYSWSGPSIVGNDDTNIITVDEAGTYTLTIIDNANNCQISDNVTVNVDRELPVVQASVSDQLSCSITSVTIDSDGSSRGNEFDYQWSTEPPGNIVGGSMGETITADAPGDYTLVITNTENGCIDSTTVSVTENPNALTAIDVDFNHPRCHNDVNGSISVAPTGGESPITYELIKDGSLFETQTDNGSFTQLGPGEYTINVSDVNGCFESQTLTLVNPPLLSIDISESVIIEEGDTVIVEAILPPGAVYDTLIWDTDTVPYTCLDSACTVIKMTPRNTVEVIATVTGGIGCSDQDEMKIIVKVVRSVYIPNIFTPNGDGINDVFLPETGRRVVRINTMQVFDRWGSLIFESRNFRPGETSFGWDGTFKGEDMAPAVFVYKVEVEFDNGEIEIINGTVTLTR